MYKALFPQDYSTLEAFNMDKVESFKERYEL